MRTLTLARMGRALLLAAAVIMLPQIASAQLPVASKSLILQDSDAGETITINPASSVTTSYTLTLPAAVASPGSFLFLSDVTGTVGTLKWSSAGGGDGYTPVWDDANKEIDWVSPTDANNPNWSRSGNAVTAGTGKLGTTTDFGFNIVTNDVARIELTAGVTPTVSINNATNIDGGLTVNDVGLTVTAGGATITAGGLTVTAGGATITDGGLTVTAGGATVTAGALTLGTAATLVTGATPGPGTAGYVLTSAGNSASPEWESITDAVGIRAKGRVAISAGNTTVQVQGITGLTTTDVITFSIEGGTAAIFGVLTVRDTDATATGGTDTGFTVTLSGAFAGSGHLNYLVQTP